jgi:ribonuclease P/MRP protein subunit RPP1
MIIAKTISELRNKLKKQRDLTLVLGGDEQINRAGVEDKRVDILISPERLAIKDYMHSRNSGLNQVLCRLASKNQVAIGFDFNFLYNSKERGRVIGRMMQNVILCRKFKVKMIVGCFANGRSLDNKTLQSFGRFLGMTGDEAKNAINFK